MRLHKGSGHARVRIHGTEHWLGPFGSPEALSAYDRLIAQYLATRGARATLVAEVPQALVIHQQPDPLPVEEELPPNAPSSIADPQPATASTELTVAELGVMYLDCVFAVVGKAFRSCGETVSQLWGNGFWFQRSSVGSPLFLA